MQMCVHGVLSCSKISVRAESSSDVLEAMYNSKHAAVARKAMSSLQQSHTESKKQKAFKNIEAFCLDVCSIETNCELQWERGRRWYTIRARMKVSVVVICAGSCERGV